MKNELMLCEFMVRFENAWEEVSTWEEPIADYIYEMVMNDMYDLHKWTTDDFAELDEYYWGNSEDLVQICLGNL